MRISAGSSNSGANGAVEVTTEGNDAPFSIRTQSDFVGTECERFTFGDSQAINNAVAVDLVTVGTLDTNGQFLTLDLRAGVVNNAIDSRVGSFILSRTYYRAAGTVSQLTAHINNFQSSGPILLLDVYISGNNIILRATNDTGVNGTFNISACWTRQEGGFTS